ncbi:hypothetical protein MTF65_23210 [Streptomyces sp. APSN-46.1]|uniref:hypothetical protein n=1 Tax=Streptomyces sp. APSN-46.1 TaxID=2929049 RepID=UPI001FB48450|nr:hypothetical protein [Streptomyces sp. APSN-46.1]MCJ1680194.1 hypothetical protein [Streptomyces sp. APSN-46.1]
MTSLVQVCETDFRVRAVRQQRWGIGLIAVASLIWLWVAFQLVFAFTIDRDGRRDRECESRAFYAFGVDDRYKQSYYESEGDACEAVRDLAPMLAWVLLSVPVGGVGLFQLTAATTRLQMIGHVAETARLTESEKGETRG